MSSSTITEQILQEIVRNRVAIEQTERSQNNSAETASAQGNTPNLSASAQQDTVTSGASQSEKPQAKAPPTSGSPRLPFPKVPWAAFQGVGEQQEGLIAIIGTVLALQAKTNSNFWSTLWQQASQSMLMEVQFAPIVGDATLAAYQAQSAATQAQANQSKWDGVTNLSMFVMSVGMGAYQEWTDDQNPLNADKNNVESQVEKDPATTPAEKAAPDPARPWQTDVQDTDSAINDEEQSFPNRAKKLWSNVKSKLSLGQKRMTGLLGRSMQASQLMGVASQAVTGFFIDTKYQAQQATYQGQEGQAQAVSQEGQQYAQFYGQAFSRDEDLRQGSQQNLDYAMNILQQAANTITQTITSMFRG